jgi:hypothetical protein
MIVPVAEDTVELCTPDDGRVCRPKHVEWTKQRNKFTAYSCICSLFLIEYYDARNNKYKMQGLFKYAYTQTLA